MTEAQERTERAEATNAEIVAQNERSNRFRNRLVAVTAAVIILLLGAVGAINTIQQDQAHQDSHGILVRIEDATNPNSAYSQQADRSLNALIARLIDCIENHSDQDYALSHHKPVPALAAGCPRDPTSPTGDQ